MTEQTTAYLINTGQNRHTFSESQTITVVGSNTSSSQSYKYAHDVHPYLNEKNIISTPPLETEIRKTENGLTKTLSKTLTAYPTSEDEAKLKILDNDENKDYPLPYNVMSQGLQPRRNAQRNRI